MTNDDHTASGRGGSRKIGGARQSYHDDVHRFYTYNTMSYLFFGTVHTHFAGNHFVQPDGHGDNEILRFDDVHSPDERYVGDETLSVEHQTRRVVGIRRNPIVVVGRTRNYRVFIYLFLHTHTHTHQPL